MPALTWLSLHHLIRLVARVFGCVLALGQARSTKGPYQLAAPEDRRWTNGSPNISKRDANFVRELLLLPQYQAQGRSLRSPCKYDHCIAPCPASWRTHQIHDAVDPLPAIKIRCSAADTPPDEDLLKLQGRHHEERDTLRC